MVEEPVVEVDLQVKKAVISTVGVVMVFFNQDMVRSAMMATIITEMDVAIYVM